jgi:hypothetical protein
MQLLKVTAACMISKHQEFKINRHMRSVMYVPTGKHSVK